VFCQAPVSWRLFQICSQAALAGYLQGWEGEVNRLSLGKL
jgi:hypothetical protein